MERSDLLRPLFHRILPIIFGLCIFILPLLIPVPFWFIEGALLLMLWTALAGMVLETRFGVNTVAAWRMKVGIIGFPPVVSMLTALFMPFDTLPLLVGSIFIGIGLSWILVKVSNVDSQIESAKSTAS